MNIKIAGVKIQIVDADSYTSSLSHDYIIEDTEKCDLKISVSKQEILSVQGENEEETSMSVRKSFAILEKLNEELLAFDAFYFHAATIAVDNSAYAFSARSGTGKSTHINLWKEYFGNRAVVVNGDRPFFRRIEDVLYACGSPWCGKEGWQTNTMVPLKSICFLERGNENSIERISDQEVIEQIFRQLRMPKSVEKMEKLLELLDWIIKHIPCYRLRCDRSMEAVEVAYYGMKER